MINAQRNITTCNIYQCKRKQWCKRYQLYLQNKDKDDVDAPTWYLAISWDSIVDFNNSNFLKRAKLRRLIDNCEYFVPTDQYIIKKKLDSL